MSERQRILALAGAAAVLQGLIALVMNSFRIFFGAFGPRTVTGMVEIFFDYATRAMLGQIPYRDYLVEYPPIALLVFLIPRLFVSGFAAYRVAFGVELLLFNAFAVLLVVRHVARAEGPDQVPLRLAWYTAFFASLCPLLMGPYDLAPMAIAFAAAHTWFHRRNALGGFLAGVGVLLKIFPGAVAAPALVWEIVHLRASRGRGMLAFLGTITAGVSFWLWLGGRGVVNSFLYHAERGLEVGSLYVGILLLLGKVKGERPTWAHDHGAIHLAPEWSDPIAKLTMPIQIAALLFVMWRYRRSGMKDGVRYAGAAVLAFMVMGKVLSPQFLIWLIPFVTVLGGRMGRRARWIYLLACIATTLFFPHIGLVLMVGDNNLGAILLLNYRNARIVGLYFLLLFGPETAAERPVTRTAK